MADRGNRKQLVGVVASDKMTKTVVVEVTRRMKHPNYHKYIQRRSRYHAHDEADDCRAGDRVLIEECRPLSRHKRWRIKEILERAV
jgi:small subunit ribosomal protein S17